MLSDVSYVPQASFWYRDARYDAGLPRHRPQTAAAAQHPQIGSAAAGHPPGLKTTKCGCRRVTTVLLPNGTSTADAF